RRVASPLFPYTTLFRSVLESAAPATLIALAGSGDGIAVVPSNVSIPRVGVKAIPIIYRATPIGRWVFVAWDRRRFFPPFAQHFRSEEHTSELQSLTNLG